MGMGDIFLKLLNMSITAGWFILAVLCIRLIFRKIPKWVNCLLWGAVAVRLICPFSIESQFSILPSAEPVKSSTIVEGKLHHDIPSIDSHLTIVENTINPMLTETFAYNESESVAPLQVVTDAAGLIWVCGMLLLTICALGSIIRLHKLVGEAVCVRERIYICDAVKSPFILGIVRPRVYLSSALSEKEMNYIIAHESAHLRRKDHWWKPLGYILLCIYWFNPLCWAAYAMLCKDIELACDEKVARDLTFHEKKEYSNILLSCTKQRRLVMVCPLAFGEVGIKERVKSVLNYRKPTIWIMTATAAVVVMLAICFLTNPTKEYRIKITIPAGSTEPFCYSNEEISPRGNTLTFYAGEGLGDTEIILLPVEVREENAYDEPAYITPGMPVKMDVEKGAWFRIGVNIQNPTDERKDVYVLVRNVEVRIASLEEDAKQQETVIDMQVSNSLTGSDPTAIAREDLGQTEPQDDEAAAAFAQDFINQFNGTIAGREKIDLTEYIGNSNLLAFAEKMIVLTQKQVQLGKSAVIYGAENEFGDVECGKIDADLYYVKVPFSYEGFGMTCQLVIQKQEAGMEIKDFYFGTKDGVDTISTGHSADRKVDNPNLWDEEDWVANVFEKLNDYERELQM